MRGPRGSPYLFAPGEPQPPDGAELLEVLPELRLAQPAREVPHVHHARRQLLLRGTTAASPRNGSERIGTERVRSGRPSRRPTHLGHPVLTGTPHLLLDRALQLRLQGQKRRWHPRACRRRRHAVPLAATAGSASFSLAAVSRGSRSAQAQSGRRLLATGRCSPPFRRAPHLLAIGPRRRAARPSHGRRQHREEPSRLHAVTAAAARLRRFLAGTGSPAPAVRHCAGQPGGAQALLGAARRGGTRSEAPEAGAGGGGGRHVSERHVRGAAGRAHGRPGHPRGGRGAGPGAGGGGQRAEPPDGTLCPQEIRKVVQALEQTAREMLTLLQGVHQGAGFQDSECGRRRGRAGRVPAQLRADAAESCSVTAVRGAAHVGVCPEAFGSDFGRGETIAE